MWEKLVGRTKVETASFYTCWTFLGLAGRKKANAQYERECTSTRWSFAAPCAYRAREIRGNKPKQRQATEKKKPLPLGVGMDTQIFLSDRYLTSHAEFRRARSPRVREP